MSLFITERKSTKRRSSARTPTPKPPETLPTTQAPGDSYSIVKAKSAYLNLPKLNHIDESSSKPMPSLQEPLSFTQHTRIMNNMEVALEMSKMIPKKNTFNRYMFSMEEHNAFRTKRANTDMRLDVYFSKADMFQKVKSNKSLTKPNHPILSSTLPLKRRLLTKESTTARSKPNLDRPLNSPDKIVLLNKANADPTPKRKPHRQKRLYTDSQYYRIKCEQAQSNFKIGKQLFLGMMSTIQGQRHSWLGDSVS